MSYVKRARAALMALLLMLPVHVTAADHEKLLITVDVIEFDCRNTHGPVEECNAALGGKRPFFLAPDFAAMESATPRNTLFSYQTRLAVGGDESTSIQECPSGNELDVDIRAQSADAGRYQIETSVTFRRGSGDTRAASTSMVVTAGEGPQLLGGGLESVEEVSEGASRTVSRFEAILLSVDTP